MAISQQVQQAVEATPPWTSWLIILGSWAVSFLQPLALLITILWGGLQIYLAAEKRWFPKKRP